MFEFLYKIPDLYILIVLSIVTIALSILSIHLTRKLIPLNLRYKDNPMLGSMSALISIIYGVLVGLTALYLINNISTTSDAVQREANAAADFYRGTTWLEEPARGKMQIDIKNYINLVINVEWPAMQRGEKMNHDGDVIINDMTNELRNYKVASQSDVLIFTDMLDNIKNLYDARQQRIQMSFSTLNPAIWAVVLIGTFLMIGICCLYSMNYYLHVITICAVSVMASAMIYLLISLDRPFQGEFSIESEALKNVLAQINDSGTQAKQPG